MFDQSWHHDAVLSRNSQSCCRPAGESAIMPPQCMTNVPRGPSTAHRVRGQDGVVTGVADGMAHKASRASSAATGLIVVLNHERLPGGAICQSSMACQAP